MSASLRLIAWSCLSLAVVFACITAGADDQPAAPADDIAGWIKDLDSDKFSTRDQASQKLAEAGERAIDEVAEAALSESREVSTRAIDILTRLKQSSEKSTKDKAQAALEQLAQGANEAAARRATQALKPPTPPPPAGQNVPFPRLPIGGIQVQGNVQINGIAGNRTIKMQNVNGRQTIEVNENGKKIEIVDDPQQGIDMSITEKVDGKDKTEKHAAKNLEELKKNHPEAAKVYEQYKGGRLNGGIIAIQVQAGGGPGGVPNIVPLPRAILPPQFLPNPLQAQQAAIPLAEARKVLAEAAEQLKKQTTDGDAESQRATLQKTLEQIQAADRKLAEAEERLGK